MSASALSPGEFTAVAEYVYGLTGIVLDKTKTYLVETRLGSLLGEYGLQSFTDLLARCRGDCTRGLEKRVIDAITTNETLFFRDRLPFDLLREKILPDLIERNKPSLGPARPTTIRIWSAACSTGQEIYSIGITLTEALAGKGRFDIRLLGSDISEAAMQKARDAQYSRLEVERGLPGPLLEKYFIPENGGFKLRGNIRSLAEFRGVNLLGNLAGVGRFDVIFCRNVAIYFSREDKAKLFTRLGSCLNRGGYLIIGSTESLRGVCDDYDLKIHNRAMYYQLKK